MQRATAECDGARRCQRLLLPAAASSALRLFLFSAFPAQRDVCAGLNSLVEKRKKKKAAHRLSSASFFFAGVDLCRRGLRHAYIFKFTFLFKGTRGRWIMQEAASQSKDCAQQGKGNMQWINAKRSTSQTKKKVFFITDFLKSDAAFFLSF